MIQEDEKILREILKALYVQFEDVPYHGIMGQDLYDTLDDYDQDSIAYVAERADGNYVTTDTSIGQRLSSVQITARGIEKLHEDGYETILQGDERYRILDFLYQLDRKGRGVVHVERDKLIEEIGDENTVDGNIWYLKEKYLVETRGGGGGLYYHETGITERGAERYEEYVHDGVEIPRTSARQVFRQTTLGPDEPEKAENLFRDFVELAREEIIIIDRFAREGLYDLLHHVPRGVQINVITTNRAMGEGYEERVSNFKENHSGIEVRFLQDSDWDFHDRYVLRDRQDGWEWGSSFHDAGETQHTPTELRPVHRETIIKHFENAWQEGDELA